MSFHRCEALLPERPIEALSRRYGLDDNTPVEGTVAAVLDTKIFALEIDSISPLRLAA